jgi:Uncharacterized protein conserved in bacteria (DUF2252)
MQKTRHPLPLPKNRQKHLGALRSPKMARSAHAFVRGSTVKFYEWLEAADISRLPQGPPVWICGDCHVGNLGPVANVDGQIEIQIRDLDQSVIGNPAHDLIRLGLSLATATALHLDRCPVAAWPLVADRTDPLKRRRTSDDPPRAWLQGAPDPSLGSGALSLGPDGRARSFLPITQRASLLCEDEALAPRRACNPKGWQPTWVCVARG